jgi:uncharacterized repeat protein (TIGR03803 family)
MAKELQNRNSSTSIWSAPVRSAWAALAVGTLLLSAVTTARSQEEKAPKPPAYSVRYTFIGGADGANPNYAGPGAGLIRDEEGNLYGTAGLGGDYSSVYCESVGCGVVFKIDRTGKETVLHTFTGPPDGAEPTAGLIRDEAGNLYGTTIGGGSAGLPAGTVFKVDRAGKETVLYSFTGGVDGNGPYASVIRDEAGNLYGVTIGGGDLSGCFGNGCGVVFKLNPAGKEAVLYSFTGGADGDNPGTSLIRDEAGNLYGTTISGGSDGQGVVFKLDPTEKETVLYSFTGGADGGGPQGLIRDREGTIYGIASDGGAFGNGVVFRLDRAGKETVLYTFTGEADGGFPYGTLLRVGSDLYGTTFFGGISTAICGGPYCGVVFKLDAAGKETVLHSFTGADGINPYAGLLPDEEGNLYGTAAYGGDLASPAAPCYGIGCGVVFKLALHEDCKDREMEGEILPSQSD